MEMFIVHYNSFPGSFLTAHHPTSPFWEKYFNNVSIIDRTNMKAR